MNNNLKEIEVDDFICNFPRGPPFISLYILKSILIIRRI